MLKRIGIFILIIVAAAASVWSVRRLVATKRHSLQPNSSTVGNTASLGPEAWDQAVAKVKEDRAETERSTPVETPTELRHYSDRHWFLAAQVAEVNKYNIQTCQDFIDLASMLERREFVPVPTVTENYVLYGVGQRADDSVFRRFEDGESVEVYTEAQLRESYRLLDEKQSQLKSEIAELKSQASRLKRAETAKQKDLQNQISTHELQVQSTEEEKSRLDEFYGDSAKRQELFHDYDALRKLAQNFAGRSYNIDDPVDRLAMKINMLSSLRPVALKIVEEVASAYHQAFNRPLPVSSLVRPEQYQHALRRVNRNAVLIETPPHSTGLAFDIDYRYMSGAEQNFLMAELARLKNAGRIEVIRESNANYHVFAFLNGTRPSDELITAALDKASEQPVEAAHHAASKPTAVKRKRVKTANKKAKAPAKKASARKRHR